MAGSVNKVILVGNLGADPEVKSFQNGGRIANLRIATSETWKDRSSGERKEKTEWHRVVIFNPNLADVAERFLKKGNTVYIEGRIRKREYEDKEGQKKFIYEILGDSMQMLGGGQRREENGQPGAAEVPGVEIPPVTQVEDDLPF